MDFTFVYFPQVDVAIPFFLGDPFVAALDADISPRVKSHVVLFVAEILDRFLKIGAWRKISIVAFGAVHDAVSCCCPMAVSF